MGDFCRDGVCQKFAKRTALGAFESKSFESSIRVRGDELMNISFTTVVWALADEDVSEWRVQGCLEGSGLSPYLPYNANAHGNEIDGVVPAAVAGSGLTIFVSEV